MEIPVARLGERRWVSLHLYHRCDYQWAATSWVQPVVASLLSDGIVDSFFFVRYLDELGPHVRLRLRLWRGTPREVVERGREMAARALDALPAAEPEAVRTVSGSVASFAAEIGLWRLVAAPLELESERYGGPAALPSSFDFFAISSTCALDYLARYGGRPRAKQRILTLCLLLWQAGGFAEDEGELRQLLDYRRGWRERMAGVIESADRVFAENRAGYLGLLLEPLMTGLGATGADAGSGGLTHLAGASRRLSGEVLHLDQAARMSVGCSQMHMTSNRLGMTLAEESAASHLLGRTVSELLEDSGTARSVQEILARRRADSRSALGGVGELLAAWLEGLASS